MLSRKKPMNPATNILVSRSILTTCGWYVIESDTKRNKILTNNKNVSNLVKDVIADFEGVPVALHPDGHHEAKKEGESQDEEIPR